ncbi:MAG: CehA/McbA family metallohydrolase [Fuerstiella sp.]|nr:CehA/McbA family metallohydrolase [Fuerstiella sp.]
MSTSQTKQTGLRILVLCVAALCADAAADQPLAANAQRLMLGMQSLGMPLPEKTIAALQTAIVAEDEAGIHELLKPLTLFKVTINPELRVRTERGPADPKLQQFGFMPFLVRVTNDATVTRELRISSPQAGPVYAGTSVGSLKRQVQEELQQNENVESQRRFLSVEMMNRSPMLSRLSGHRSEYQIALISCSEVGTHEATVMFDIGQGTQDLGFRSEIPVLFNTARAVSTVMRIRDFDGRPTTARLEFRDSMGRIYPPQAKRLAPDFFFQPQIYRADGEIVLLPPGDLIMTSSRGPEYRRNQQRITIPATDEYEIAVQLERWVNPADYGFFSGDHHIHGAGCSHYTNPTEGVTPLDMFAQVKGEGLNVGCVLTWGPCFDFQRKYFSPLAADISEDLTLLKYDLEISGFGSAALGHVCLLNLSNQSYPGSEGTSSQGWPTWTVPVLRWTKEQGGVTGYPHSSLRVVPESAADWLVAMLDRDQDGTLEFKECRGQLLPDSFPAIDADDSGVLTHRELVRSATQAAGELPNTVIPSMDGGGAMEIFVSTAEGVCDFISAMDTPRIGELNPWYHLLNCGFELKLSGETDFPCMSSRRVGQGRVYVQLGESRTISFPDWCRGIADGRSYVSDGFAHALCFEVNDTAPGLEPVNLQKSGNVLVSATVVFSAEVPRAVAHGTHSFDTSRNVVGDTRVLHAERNTDWVNGGDRTVEIVVNGTAVAHATVPADGEPHELQFSVPVHVSSWIALRQFPQLHTNPVTVVVKEEPVRASRASAVWCARATQLLWHNRQRFIASAERPVAKKYYERAVTRFLTRAVECPDDGLQMPVIELDPVLTE